MIIMMEPVSSVNKSYTEWVHCNSCWLKIHKKEPNFRITQCGHVYCTKCIVLAEKRCFQCGATGIISLPVKEPLSLQVAHYFTDPAVLRDKAKQAEMFQKSQMKLYLQRADAIEFKYQTLKQEYLANSEHLKKFYQKYNKLKMACAALQKENKKLLSASGVCTPTQYKTPPNQINKNSSYVNDDEGLSTITEVPRSAGYFTASSNSSNTSSNYQMITPKSDFLH